MVGGQEAYRYRTVPVCVGHCPSSVILTCVNVAETLRYVVVIDFGIVLFHYPFQCRYRFIQDAVGRGVAADFSVSYPERKIGIGIETPFRLEFHLSAHVFPVQKPNLAFNSPADRQYFGIMPLVESCCEGECRIFSDNSSVCSFKREYCGAVRENGVMEKRIGPILHASVSRHAFPEVFRFGLAIHVTGEGIHDGDKGFPVDRKVIVLIEVSCRLRQLCREPGFPGSVLTCTGGHICDFPGEIAEFHGACRLCIVFRSILIRLKLPVQ